MTDLVAAGVAATVVALFAAMAIEDGRTGRVTVRTAQLTTAVAMVGLGTVGVAAHRWGSLVEATAGAVVVTGLQLVPYLAQRRKSQEPTAIGKADVRLAVPFGWTLGWFGLGFAFAGFATALVTGLAAALVTRRQRIRFVPFLLVGLVAGLVLAAVGTGN